VTATAFTAGGLTRYLGEGSATGFRIASREPIPSPSNLPAHKAIILFEDKRPEKLLAPTRPSLAPRNNLALTKPQPLNIPFNGAYWFFQPPDREPGNESLRKHGSPTQFSFYSNNGRPLAMEARQNLGRLIDVDCCSKILVAIENLEPRSKSVALELALANTTLPAAPSMELSAKAGAQSAGGATQQTLTFIIPAAPAIPQFDEVLVVFHRSPQSSTRSAKVAIQGFTLVPRP
jgi:hypothetical protein